MKNFSIPLVITGLLVVATGLYFFVFLEEEEDVVVEPPEEAYIIGEIYDISERQILVAEGIRGEGYDGSIDDFIGNAGWFRVDEETFFVKNGENLTFENLEVGNRVAITVTGEVMESYPVQAMAKKVEFVKEDEEEIFENKENEEEVKEETKEEVKKEIEKDELAKECYIGGCSGELCTSDPEAISTCELLPGMECLRKEMRCEFVAGECSWVFSQEAAKCFLEIQKTQGDQVTKTRIGYLFDEAKKFLE
jgi:eight-cysteine-cluster-containing protein